MTDIVERLRTDEDRALQLQAADEIERLRAFIEDVARLGYAHPMLQAEARKALVAGKEGLDQSSPA